MHQPIHDVPSQVDAEGGVVLVDGPGGIVLAFTPEAAADTSDRLLDASARAQGQRIEQDRRKKRQPGEPPF
jgi:hypothetical protein